MNKTVTVIILVIALTFGLVEGLLAGNPPIPPISNHKCVVKTKGPGDPIIGCYFDGPTCAGECYKRNSGTMYVGECDPWPGQTCSPYWRSISFSGTETECINAGNGCVCSDIWVPITGTINYKDCDP
jgi:hypothetical protein